MGGIRIQSYLTLDQVSPEESAMLILPGGTSWDQGQEIEAVEVARSFLDAGYGLFKTGRAGYFHALMQAMGA